MSHIIDAIDDVVTETNVVREWGVRQARDVTFQLRLLEVIKNLLETYESKFGKMVWKHND